MAFPFLRDWLAQRPDFARFRAAAVKMGQSVLLTSLATLGCVSGLRTLGLFEHPELALYDQFIRLQGDRPPDDRILVVGINELDLQTLQEWPVSDLTLARVLAALQTHQPRIIGVDILRDIPSGEGRASLIEQLQSPNVIIVCKVNSADEPGTAPPAELSRQSVVFSDLVVDSGGILRRSLLFMNPPPSTTPGTPTHACNSPDTLASLSLGVALNYLSAEGISASFNAQNHLQLGSALFPPVTPNFGSYRDVDANGYQVMLRYRAEEHSVPIVSLTDVLNGRVSDAQIRDRIILVGYTAALAKDDFYTPYSLGREDQQKMPGVVVHAQAASQILSVALDGQPLIVPWPLPLELIWISAWTVATGMFAWYVRHPAWFISGVLLLGGTAYSIALILFPHGVWVPIFPVLVSIGISAAGVVLLDRFNNSAYGQQVVKQVKTLLNIDIDKKKLEKQVSEITETDYFRDLKSKAKILRSRSSSNPPPLPQHKTNLKRQPRPKLDFLPENPAGNPNPDTQQSNTEPDNDVS